MSQRIVVALDGIDKGRAMELAEQLSGAVWGFKVNSLLLECGIDVVSRLKKFGNVFADPKLYDIPNTVTNSVRSLSSAGADLITIHASGGSSMIRAALEASAQARILTVTALTSLNSVETLQTYGAGTTATVLRLASVARDSGADGIVCSCQELELLAEPSFSGLFKVVPGIRPAGYGKQDDQTRVATPSRAVELGADLLVIGRPIVAADSPLEAARAISEELGAN